MLFSFQRPERLSSAASEPVQAQKKPLRRRGPRAARDVAVRPSRLSVCVVALAPPTASRATGECSTDIWASDKAAAKTSGAASAQTGAGSIARPDGPAPAVRPITDPPELAPADLEDARRRAGRRRRRASSGPERLAVEADPALAQQPAGLAAGRAEVLGQQRRQVHDAVGDRLAARERRPPRSPRAAGAPCGRGRSAARPPRPRRRPWKRSTMRRASARFCLHRRQRPDPAARPAAARSRSPSPRRARSSACRTSPRAARSRPT